MHKLIQEAVQITKDLGEVVFVGAVGILLHTKLGRQSHDLDIAVASKIPEELLQEKQYFIYREKKDSRYTPRGYKIDIMHKEVSDIPVELVIKTAKVISISGVDVRAASLEVLLVSKFRAADKRGGSDEEDIRTLARTKYKEIEWDKVKELVKDDVEYQNIKMTMDTLHKKNLRF